MTAIFALFFFAGLIGLIASVAMLQHSSTPLSPEPSSNSWFHRWASVYFLGVAVLSLLALSGLLRIYPTGMATWVTLLHTVCGAGLQLCHAATMGYYCHRARRSLAARNFQTSRPMLRV